jgi:lipopolysaccharide export system permease protein
MILAELLKVFALALVALTGLILVAGVVAEAMKTGLSPAQVAALIPLLLPSLLPYTVPTATLFATCVVYSRLAADNEILALKASGVHIIQVVWPALLLGAAASAATLWISLDLIPYSQHVLRNQSGVDVEETLYSLLRRDGRIHLPRLRYEIDVKDVRGRILHDVIFKKRAAPGKGYEIVAQAREAELQVDLDQRCIFVHMRFCHLIQQNSIGVLEKHTWPMELPGEMDGSQHKQRATDMAWSELTSYKEKHVQQKERIDEQIAFHQNALARGVGAAHFVEHIRSLANESKNLRFQILSIENERNQRPAFALGCFFFALIGCPVGIWFSKSDFLSAFVTCFLPIVTLYYPLLLCTINLSRSGTIPAWLGLHDANALMLLAGLILFRRLARN